MSVLLGTRLPSVRRTDNHEGDSRSAPRLDTVPSGAHGGGEQFDQIAGWVGETDLVSPGTRDHVAAEGQSGAAQSLDLGVKIVHDEMDAVPAGSRGVGRRSAGTGAARSRQQQPQPAAEDVGEGG